MQLRKIFLDYIQIYLKGAVVGTKIKFGECLTKSIQIDKQCHRHCQIYHKVGTCIMPQERIFVRVLEGGSIKAGDEVRVLEED